MKLAFGIFLIIHGVIHLMGFTKAFFSTKISMLVLGISKPLGTFWLIAFVLFVLSAVQFFNNKKWFCLVFVAVCISQVLIVIAWKDSKFGSIPNAIILLVSISHYADFKFNIMVQKESVALFERVPKISSGVVSEKDIIHLPEIVEKWMKNSGVIGKPPIHCVRLKQKGQLKNKPSMKRVSFNSEQYINVNDPAFVWSAKIKNNALMYVNGRDKLNKGKAEMLIKIWGIIPVVNAADNFKINSGSMQRFLGEMCWFPSAAMNNYISWESMSDNSAKAIFTYNSQSVSGVFKFNAEGAIVSFETNRFYGGKSDSKKEKWVINVLDYKVFDSYKIPNKCKVTWKLKDGDFNWLYLEVLDVNYNKPEPYLKLLN